MAPTTTATWRVEGKGSFDNLKFDKSAPLPELGDHDVLIKIEAASLNYRDLIIPLGQYPFPLKDPVVPGSDGAGTVEEVGSRVTLFKKGDKVCTLFNQGHQAGYLRPAAMGTGLGGGLDGTLRRYAVFEEKGLVNMPKNLDFVEASTLTCAAVTAWNALYGLESRALKAGDTVLTQGTGGVSLFALQFALAAGCTVIATTSSEAKAKKLKELGAHHVINYKEDPNWGETAKKLTPDGEGVHHIVEVGGPSTMTNSLAAVRIEGVISIIGFVGGFPKDQPGFIEALQHTCTVRGIVVGSKLQFEDMNRAIEATDLKPVVDPKTFGLEQLKDAFNYMWDQNHFGKVVIKVSE